MGIWEVLPFIVALWLSNLSKIDLRICLIPVFRMARVNAFSIGLNQISFPVQPTMEKSRLCLNKVVSRCNYSHVSVAMCLAAEWWEQEFFYTSASKQRFQFTCYKFLIVKKPMTLLHMLFKTKILCFILCCFLLCILSVVYFGMVSNF